jgi:protein gp37
MSDLFHPDVPVKFIASVWKVMQETPRHTYQILTKRPERMASVLSSPEFPILQNVWLGTSVEDSCVLYRLDAIRAVPAAVRFVSLEPLIGSVAGGDLANIDWAIVGGESGPRAREMKPEWVDEIASSPACSERPTIVSRIWTKEQSDPRCFNRIIVAVTAPRKRRRISFPSGSLPLGACFAPSFLITCLSKLLSFEASAWRPFAGG